MQSFEKAKCHLSVFSHKIRVGLVGKTTNFHFSPVGEINLRHVDSSVNQPMNSNLGFSFIKARKCYQDPLDCEFKKNFRKMRNSTNETLKNLMSAVFNPGAIRNIWGAF